MTYISRPNSVWVLPHHHVSPLSVFMVHPWSSQISLYAPVIEMPSRLGRIRGARGRYHTVAAAGASVISSSISPEQLSVCFRETPEATHDKASLGEWHFTGESCPWVTMGHRAVSYSNPHAASVFGLPRCGSTEGFRADDTPILVRKTTVNGNYFPHENSDFGTRVTDRNQADETKCDYTSTLFPNKLCPTLRKIAVVIIFLENRDVCCT